MVATWDEPRLDQVQRQHPGWLCRETGSGGYAAKRIRDGHEVTAASTSGLRTILRTLDAEDRDDAGTAGLR